MFGFQGTPEQIKKAEEENLTDKQRILSEERVDGLKHDRSTGNYEIPKSSEEFRDLMRELALQKLKLAEIQPALRSVQRELISSLKARDNFFTLNIKSLGMIII